MTDSTYAHLPTEILIKIFHQLEFYDLQSVKLCCRHWLAVTLRPEFATRGVFKISSGILDSNHPAAKILLNKQITKLYLKGVCFGDTDELFEHIGESLQELTLKLVAIDTALPLIMKHFPNLRCLKVSHIKLSSLIGNISWLSKGNLPQIQEMTLLSNDSIVNKYILDSINNTKSLRALTIEFSYKDEVFITNVIDRHYNNLRELDLRYYEGAVLNYLKWGTLWDKIYLTKLCLQGNFQQDILIHAIDSQKILRSLDLTGSVAVDDNFLFRLGKKIPELEKLRLDYCGRITNRGVNQLAILTKLKALGLTGCNKLTSLSVHSIIGRTPNWSLMELYLQNVNIDESDVCFCANNLPNLRIFDVSSCGKAVTDKAIQEIFDCQRKLEGLKIDNCQVTDEGILGLSTGNSIQNLKFLKMLSLRCCKGLTDLSLTTGLRIPQLKFLDISHCDKITILGLQSLVKNCSTIEEMRIANIKGMGREAVRTLTSELGRLRLLNVENCRDLTEISVANWIHTKFLPFSNEVTLKRHIKHS